MNARMKNIWKVVILILGLLPGAMLLPAADGYALTRTDAPPKIDGVLDDAVWQTLQTVPGDGTQKIITNSIATPGQRFYRLRVE